jgi:hypothetical protein
VGIPWNREAVYSYYGGEPNHWTREQVDSNIFEHYDEDHSQFSEFDPKSIMLYAVPQELTIGDYEIEWNTELSNNDKDFMISVYPRKAKPLVRLEVDGPPAEAPAEKHGEEHPFRPNVETRFVAEDDERDKGSEPRLSRRLDAGTYFLRVRHYWCRGSKKYRISVNTTS